MTLRELYQMAVGKARLTAQMFGAEQEIMPYDPAFLAGLSQ